MPGSLLFQKNAPSKGRSHRDVDELWYPDYRSILFTVSVHHHPEPRRTLSFICVVTL